MGAKITNCHVYYMNNLLALLCFLATEKDRSINWSGRVFSQKKFFDYFVATHFVSFF